MSYRRNRRAGLHGLWRMVEVACAASATSLVRLLLLPFRVLADAVQHFGRSLHRSRRRLAHATSFHFWLSLLRLPFVEAIRLARWLGFQVIGWWPKASFVHLFQGLPAVVIALLVTIPLVGPGQAKNTSLYVTAASKALERDDYKSALVYYRALSREIPNNDDLQFNIARCAAGLKTPEGLEQALGIMNGLAPAKKSGYPAAHLWLADWLLHGGLTQATADEAEGHLLRLAQGGAAVDPETTANALTLLAGLYVQEGRLADAEQNYVRLVAMRPEFAFQLAFVRRQQGKDEWKKDAERALAIYAKETQKNLDNVSARLRYANALFLLSRFEETIAVLDQGLKLTSDPQFHNSIGMVYFHWSQMPSPGDDKKFDKRYELLGKAFRFVPSDYNVLRALISGLWADGEESAAARYLLRTLVTEGQAPAYVNLLLAVDSDHRGQKAAANRYLTKAEELSPQFPVVMAGVARFFVNPPPRPRDGMELVDLGLRVWPKNADLRLARGALFHRDAKWLEAVIDLEAALPAKPDDRSLHELLADAYDHLGMTDKAISHRQRARQGQ